MASPRTTPSALGPIRPVQFLGAKTRSLPVLLDVLGDELPRGAAVADLFSGSSLVAQGLARSDRVVSAYDALEHCAHFARALLGVGRDEGRGLPQLAIEPGAQADAWEPWLEQEQEAIRQGDDQALIELSQSLPQIWRPQGASKQLAGLFSRLTPGARAADGLVAAHYAGTYFGLGQAMEIDLIRRAIDAATEAGEIDGWQESLLITALLSAASDCAFSAGKHYAQPHRIREGKDLAFVRGRILQDRQKDLRALFDARLEWLFAGTLPAAAHAAEARTLEQLVGEPSKLAGVDAIYADPPYTAQQYSRFYHVPEVISAYRVPTLQQIDGEVTRGLYPEPIERHHSRFCSRREAPAAFADLCELAAGQDALLCLSYSFTRNGKTGNRRSIELPQLREIVAEHFSQVTERELPLAYRQFNTTEISIASRSDAEILLVAKNR
jgi:adenine-specific DNA methylase